MTGAESSTEITGDTAALERRLAERSYPLRVEGRGGVALLVPIQGQPLQLDAAQRRWIVQQGREAGFANIALEIPEPWPEPQPQPEPEPEPEPEPQPEPTPEPVPEPTRDPTPEPVPQQFPGPGEPSASVDATLSRRDAPR